MSENKQLFDNSTILESISDGVFTINDDWKISSFNRAAEQITGIDRSDALGRYCSEVFRSSLCGEHCALRETLKTGKPIIDKGCYFINSKGKKISVTLSTAVLKDQQGNIIGGAETFRDVTEIEVLKKQLSKQTKSGSLISRSQSMQSVIAMVEAVAETSATVLITGETGTGKEVTAKALHQLSERNKQPFIALNCAALPENLLESALFGHVKGAFTGAIENKLGYFARAARGTLFLDEIGDISPALQVRLLRVLQEREFEPVGSNKPQKTDARIITATNKNLSDLVSQGTFREDLYYRLNVIKIVLPPLAKRVDDIPFLVKHFIERFNLLHKKAIKGISSEALQYLQSYSWPGNIRELENSIERACLLSKNSYIQLSCFPFVVAESSSSEVRESNEQVRLDSSREEIEKQLIIAALKNNHSKLATAKALGIHKTTLFRKMKRYQIAF
ncbi:sigma-54 interaction domain-containing protein [Psychromonas antarctica]|jgi:PAS domain S-box-containing protein|uniref:sigma-54 interaction domain-containing protein n=1 Tax=Psychromonas antarctica TaxID=67573 RepID=UPI001EE7C16B|nr:sigma 54-interacting transcriptional regulator [Psychromonas antarctica]MCG6201041.1 sigma 54-interacting transcriptional regulator [Psychromonas antarctica]